ncbi:MAG: hypothetical protein J6N93_06210 [Clostridia bacterium]|nr:hypothetical protein [Clostridia bacterium]
MIAYKKGGGNKPEKYDTNGGEYVSNDSSGKPTKDEEIKELGRKYDENPKAFADSLKIKIDKPKYIEKKVETDIKVTPAEYRIIQSQVMDKVANGKAKGNKLNNSFGVRTANNYYRIKTTGYDFKIVEKFDIEKDFEFLNSWGEYND